MLAIVATGPAHGQDSAEQFFRGKTINIYVGSSAGGGYDTYGRLVARHFGKHIPGQPTIVVQNMPGAGANKAAGYIYSVAPKDGTAIGAIFPARSCNRCSATPPSSMSPTSSSISAAPTATSIIASRAPTRRPRAFATRCRAK